MGKHWCLVLVIACQVAVIASQVHSSSSSGLRKCQWVGDAPFCGKPTCPYGSHQADRNKYGDGHRCLTGKKVLCCEESMSMPAFTTSRTTTTTRKPYARPSQPTRATYPYPKPTAVPPSPYRNPVNTPTDNAYGSGGGGYGYNDPWKGKSSIPIPITIDKSDDVKPIKPITPAVSPPRGPTPTKAPTSKPNSRQEDILAFLRSLDDLP